MDDEHGPDDPDTAPVHSFADHMPTEGPVGVLIREREDLQLLAARLAPLKVEAIVVQRTVDDRWVPLIMFDGGTHWALETRPTRDTAYSAGVYVLQALAKLLAGVRKKVPEAILGDDVSAFVAAETAASLWRRRNEGTTEPPT
ncbi:hypothetical protein [Dermatobacter hominis]|uniref:hypothetical protein n=1 Tax=Dermatobacter hominis TaxID=2884263 RepID=UPI001D0FCDF7|nr:hypothetical protein [Dermatobacter hominis]UDY35682.1 hypothetical protein LH044_20445 [Dermatobacter hominis]